MTLSVTMLVKVCWPR